jgi:prepilin-type processing-associated H-X9-DG protein
MAISFACPHCGCRTTVESRLAGERLACGSCDRMMTVPAASAENAAGSAEMPSAASVIAMVVCLLLVGAGLAVLFLPADGSAREAGPRPTCANNLKQLGVGLHNYHEEYGCFPCAVEMNDEGQAMRSWRTTILPYVEHGHLFERYKLDEPWNSTSNQSLLDEIPGGYRCPAVRYAGSTETSYVMIVGEGTVGGEPNEGVSYKDITDGTSRTIMAIEVAESGIPWLEPRDVTVQEAVEYITNPAASDRKHAHRGGVMVLMADGSVYFIGASIDPQNLTSLLLRDDGQGVVP